jgi:hypothetical protein
VELEPNLLFFRGEPDMMRNARQGPAQSLCKPVLIIDDTTAHLTACPEEAAELLAWFQRRGIGCSLRRQAGIGGLDLLDFGNPSPAEERLIRAVFGEWQKRLPGVSRSW